MSPEAQDYVNVISKKSEHLKEMIQDLFEISKATSGNAELVLEKLDMVKLLQQTLGDMEDRISSSGRIIRTVLPEEPLYISGDGKRLYRVYQNLMENALKYSMSQGSERQGMNVSNFFDNTTVYVGKYFGNALYADAMLRLTYDKNRVNDGTTLQGLTFEPEIGFEMESPLANIRWGLTPDLSDLSRSKISIVPSLTLSWKFNY